MNRLIPWICGGIIGFVTAARAIAEGGMWERVAWLTLGVMVGFAFHAGSYALIEWQDRRRR